jgi:hypothetical protein
MSWAGGTYAIKPAKTAHAIWRKRILSVEVGLERDMKLVNMLWK